jgi:hypothetical protein
MAELSIGGHFSFDSAGIAARRSRRYTFLEKFIENAAIRFLVPRGE